VVVDIIFGYGLELSPGGSRSYVFLRYLDYVRANCSRLRKDTYLRYLVQSDYSRPTCEISLNLVSSDTFNVLLSYLDQAVKSRDLGEFDRFLMKRCME